MVRFTKYSDEPGLVWETYRPGCTKMYAIEPTGPEHHRWKVVCVDHGTTETFPTQAEAVAAIRAGGVSSIDPRAFCPKCCDAGWDDFKCWSIDHAEEHGMDPEDVRRYFGEGETTDPKASEFYWVGMPANAEGEPAWTVVRVYDGGGGLRARSTHNYKGDAVVDMLRDGVVFIPIPRPSNAKGN